MKCSRLLLRFCFFANLYSASMRLSALWSALSTVSLSSAEAILTGYVKIVQEFTIKHLFLAPNCHKYRHPFPNGRLLLFYCSLRRLLP